MHYTSFLRITATIILSISGIIECSHKHATCSGTTDACTPASTSDLTCTGSGKIFEIPDECLNDGGRNAVGDSLEIYCVCNRARFCLSGEVCPWRNPTTNPVDDGRTCSRAGLTTSYMGNAWCKLWKNHKNYNCCYDGFIGF